MNENKILHVMILDKFLAPFIDFVDENFGRENHHYVFITSEKYEYGLTPEHKVEFLHTDDDIFITLLDYMKMAKKIILHGLWRDKVDILLYFNQELLKKCYWVMWGGDFYFPEKQTWFRNQIIKNIRNFITLNIYDFEYVKNKYFTFGTLWKCPFYPKNLFKEISTFKVNQKLKILVGNSATITNRHEEIFNLLTNLENKEFEIYCPLSYGDKIYANKIIQLGKLLFKNDFHHIDTLLTPQDYLDFLETIDLAIFNHNRQQGGGNIISLLGLGKTVYLNRENNMYDLFKNMNLIFYSIEDLSNGILKLIDQNAKFNNISIVQDNYSEKESSKQWQKIFND
ncbi:TDP-N-acetylfucosamine:lipid II N-acetylfucosaminyltransferase [Aliarcobacter skirrowii]|uniref:TDP-N-acetylfucosamine:lipid II N-acetylfucosaminyltransferase n=1 Tax=Aliarcobacter skirrowii TaxID=28200 RepID=UPI0029B7AAC4|nr:TDP-N-acetylfucosamine:lipid II N-acetylfucosaminyltransferase [Aliarcobacter skirrowii]MDX4028240.1 TDP-N-acetylfucosamine:lipid II N-acetylfucosaminyltransferase [Aliarcobacter skirrowii]